MSFTPLVLSALAIIILLIVAISMIYLLLAKRKRKRNEMAECTELLDKYIAILSSDQESKKRAKLIKNWQEEVKNWNSSFNRIGE